MNLDVVENFLDVTFFSCFAAEDNYVCRTVIPELVERDETEASSFSFFFFFFFNIAVQH